LQTNALKILTFPAAKLIKNGQLLTQKPGFQTRKSIFLVGIVSFLEGIVTFLVGTVNFPTRIVTFLVRTVSFLARIPSFRVGKATFRIRIVTFLIYPRAVPVRKLAVSV